MPGQLRLRKRDIFVLRRGLRHLTEELACRRHCNVGRQIGKRIGHELLDPLRQLRLFILLVVPGVGKNDERKAFVEMSFG